PNYFFPALFQVKVKKAIELRIFAFFDLIFCTAFISSRESNKSEIDVRILIAEGKTESYPFLLPASIKEKINSMMKALKLDMASIDLIIDEEGEYVFLDLNPFGQISMLSDSFSHLEKDVVNKVIDYAKRRNNRSE